MKEFYLSIKTIIILFLVGANLSSCSDDDGYSLGDIWIAKFATVNNVGEPIRSFTIDDNITLAVAASNIPNYIPKEPRATITYTILGDTENGHLIKLNGIAEIPTEDIININQNDLVNITNDPIELKSLRISDQYLNIDFGFQYGNNSENHNFNLYKIDLNKDQRADNIINLEFIHQANKDSKRWIRRTARCFNLRSLNLPKQEKVTLKIKLNTIEDGEKYINIDYTPS